MRWLGFGILYLVHPWVRGMRKRELGRQERNIVHESIGHSICGREGDMVRVLDTPIVGERRIW